MSHIVMEATKLEAICRHTIECIKQARLKADADKLKNIIERQNKFRKLFFLHKIFPATEESAKRTLEWDLRYTNSLYGRSEEIANSLIKLCKHGNPVTVTAKDFVCLVAN